MAIPFGGAARDKADYSRELRTQLIEQVMPYWYDTALDRQNGGYLLADDKKGRGEALEKQLVTQSRMVWGFSHAYLHHLGDGQHDYLAAARSGYSFLTAHFLDPQTGGYFWKTDLAGKVRDDRKLLYGQAFVIYSFVEYYRASHDGEALRRAVQLYTIIQLYLHDNPNGGWFEHAGRDWQPILRPDPTLEVEIAGLKSANAHLHWMEALTELYDVTRDPNIRNSLVEALRVNMDYFYPLRPGASSLHRQLDWRPVGGAESAGLSYGHNVEFAWLMVRAQLVLGVSPAWPHFFAHLNHALKYGYDHERGGLYSRGLGDQPAYDTEKVWWVQAEMLAALTDALRVRPNPEYEKALDQLLHFILNSQIDPADGIWLWSVDADGKPRNTTKANSWKANYHDVRAMVKFIEAFPYQPPPNKPKPVVPTAPKLAAPAASPSK